MRQGFPYAASGQVIGLLGGSFDPPHEGHAHLTREALKRFGLDQVWWMVSPGNPLKEHGPAPLVDRIAASQQVMQHPKVKITGVEAELGSPFTAQTIRSLQRLYPDVRFVWLMGADNMVQLNRWQDWQQIMQSVPVGVIARAGQRLGARRSVAARMYRGSRLVGRSVHALGQANAPAWAYVNVPLVKLSSSEIRRSGAWGAKK